MNANGYLDFSCFDIINIASDPTQGPLSIDMFIGLQYQFRRKLIDIIFIQKL